MDFQRQAKVSNGIVARSLLNKGVLQPHSLAKYAAAFLRNTLRRLQCKAKLSRASMQTFYDSLPIFLLVVIRPWVLIVHAETHGVIEQDRDLSSGSSKALAFPIRAARRR